MKDFTLNAYHKLLKKILSKGYQFSTFEDFIQKNYNDKKLVILRHDVDKAPNHSLRIAKLEKKLNIFSSYYFRITPNSNDPNVIRSIVELGHEIGYHYEDLTLSKGDFEKAIISFKKNLKYFREFYQVKTICMHGSPFSRWDNRDIWAKIDYRKFEIIGEPYIDLNFNELAYLTDTGRKWNSNADNIRDKVDSTFSFNFKTTFEVIKAFDYDILPDKVMINTHPQRWTNNNIDWVKELFSQSLKNIIKKII